MTEPLVQGDMLRVIAIAGSLRRMSYNRALLCAAQQLAPPSLRIDIEELDDVPMFNADLDAGSPPEGVAGLRQALLAADGLLLVTPEYNHGVPGVMKNAIDWLSQPLRQSVLHGKPTALMGASTGPRRHGPRPDAATPGLRADEHAGDAPAPRCWWAARRRNSTARGD